MNEQQTLRSLIDAWFRKQGFRQLRFEGPTERITTQHMEHTLVYKLHHRPDHDTFYKEATGGSLIVFEVSLQDGVVRYDGYCPLLLFGIWERRLSFKRGAGKLAGYRKEGFEVEQQFLALLERHSSGQTRRS